jgi:hypothetical protein
VRAVPHATAQLMSLALPDSSVRCKRHESAMNSVMNTVLGRGSAMSANVRAMKDALMPVRLHRSNSLRIAWVLPIESQERAGLWKLIGSEIPSKGRQALAQLHAARARCHDYQNCRADFQRWAWLITVRVRTTCPRLRPV